MLCSVTEVRPGLSLRMGENVSHREVMSMIWPSDRPSVVLGCVEVVILLSEYVGTSLPSESSSKISSKKFVPCSVRISSGTPTLAKSLISSLPIRLASIDRRGIASG